MPTDPPVQRLEGIRHAKCNGAIYWKSTERRFECVSCGERMLEAISESQRVVAEGNKKSGLSRSEARLLPLLIQGKVGKEIAFALSLSESTVKCHLRSMRLKLRLPNSRALAIWAHVNRTSWD